MILFPIAAEHCGGIANQERRFKERLKAPVFAKVTTRQGRLKAKISRLRRRAEFPTDAPGSLLDAEQFHLENQYAVGRNRRGRALVAVSQSGRDEQLPLVANLHQLQRLGPSRDHAVDRETGGLTTLNRAVEDRPVNQRALVMHLDRIRHLGGLARAGLDDLVLQPAGRGDDTFLFGVFSEKGCAGTCLHARLVPFTATTGEHDECERQNKK